MTRVICELGEYEAAEAHPDRVYHLGPAEVDLNEVEGDTADERHEKVLEMIREVCQGNCYV